MATITLRSTKGSPLTITEVDNNFSNLNTYKVELTTSTGSAKLPVGTTAERDGAPSAGWLRFNSSTTQAELYNGTSWSSVGGATLTDDTTTNATYYPSLATATSGTALTLKVSSTKLSFNPSTGTLSATAFSGSGASLTALSASSLSSGTVATARLATGTANSSTYLRGDQTWAAVASGASLSNDVTTNATYYPIWATVITGTPTTVYTSDTKLYFNPSTGTLNATNFNSLSDITLKENVELIQNATRTLQNVTGVEFDWKDNGKKSAGVIAQKLEEILPHLVETSAEGIKSVNYSGLVAYLIESVKELSARVEHLENK